MSSYDLNLNNNKIPAVDRTKNNNTKNKLYSNCNDPPIKANGTDPIR